MKKILFVICLLTIFSLEAQTNDDLECTSIYLIRHAEKDRTDKRNSNPHLNSLGIERSLRWKSFFKYVKFDEFYSTNYYRTLETIKPIAEDRAIQIYNPSSINYDEFILKNKGKTILVVGHSNTIPTFANMLLKHEVYQDIEDTNNSNLYVINVCDNSEILNTLYFVK